MQVAHTEILLILRKLSNSEKNINEKACSSMSCTLFVFDVSYFLFTCPIFEKQACFLEFELVLSSLNKVNVIIKVVEK